jgi:hypothetical protein
MAELQPSKLVVRVRFPPPACRLHEKAPLLRGLRVV